MEQAIMTMLQDGVSPTLILNVVLSAVALFIVMCIKGFLENLLYWKKFKSSTVVSFGTKIQVGTATGSKRGVVLPESTRRRIAVDFGDAVRYYTPKEFMTGHFEVVKVN
jgi:hypothetical protein